MNNKQFFAIMEKNKKIIINHCGAEDKSGIYYMTRYDDDEFKFAYVGQSNKILTRLASHLSGYEQHIDKSLKAHGLYSEDNIHGWKIRYTYVNIYLDDFERSFIKSFHHQGFQLLNKTSGGQDSGKRGISENKPSKGYHDGLKQGYKNAQKYVARLFEKNLIYSINGKDGKLKQNALANFEEFIGGK